MNSAIVIPARYGSKRLPGKPLADIAGKTMLQRVGEIALTAAEAIDNTEILVATEDERILDHAKDIGLNAVMTSESCPTGSDRILEAIGHLDKEPDFVVNLQGDAPLTPPDFVTAVLNTYKDNTDLEVVTPVTQLSWEQLDTFRENKKTTPLSGTTVILDTNNQAKWFSKQIIPGIRGEDDLRQHSDMSPVYRHVGIYGFRTDILKRFVALEQSHYEKLEGLEQLRMLENGISIQATIVDYQGRPSMSGVDCEEDIARAEAILKEHGDLAA